MTTINRTVAPEARRPLSDMLPKVATEQSALAAAPPKPQLPRPDWRQIVPGALLAVVGVVAVVLMSQNTIRPVDRPQAPAVVVSPVAATAISIPTAAPAVWTKDASWSPDGARIVVEGKPGTFTGERIGDRCRVSLPQGAQPWVPCALVGQPAELPQAAVEAPAQAVQPEPLVEAPAAPAIAAEQPQVQPAPAVQSIPTALIVAPTAVPVEARPALIATSMAQHGGVDGVRQNLAKCGQACYAKP